jgi:Tfp pilus assembly protein PilF
MPLKPIALAPLLLAFSLSGVCQTAPGTSDPMQQHMRNAQQYLNQKRPDLAIPEFEAALALDPANRDAQANLGVLLYFSGEFAKAAPHLRAAVKAQPDLWKIQALLGLTEDRLKDESSARADLESALPHLKGEKIQMEVGKALVESYTATGDLAKAASAASVMLESQPTDSSLLLMSYRLYSDLANNAMLTLAMAAPHSAEMHQAMAIELGRHGDEAAAIANYRMAIQIDPKLPGLYFQFGTLLYTSTDQKLKSEAEAQFQAALAVNPQDEKAQLMLGKLAGRRGDLKAAYDADARAVEMQPNDADACTEFAMTLIYMDERDKARRLLVHALEIDPTDYIAHYRLSTVYRLEGKTEEAKREVAEYKKYRDMREKLGTLFQDMRVQFDNKPDDDVEMPK